jgi:serine/threonine-protein kinase
LEKNPGRRFRSAHDLGFALETLSGVSPLPPARPRTASRLARLSLWTLATAAAVIAGIAGTRRAPALGIPTPKRFAVPLAGLDFEVEQYFAIAPDGSSLVYGGGRRLEQPLSLYDLRDGSTRTIPGTGAAAHPFFSPDGRWLGFFQALKLKKVALGGGSPVTLCDSPGSVASWGADDRILGGAARSDAGGLWQVPAAGGRRQPLTKLSIAAREAAHSTPRLMPDGDSVLFTISGGDDVEASQIALLSLRDGSYRTLLRGGANARYSPTGHLVYTRGNDLMAVPFDARRLAVTGAPSVALTGLRRLVDSENSFDLATDGTLAFIAGGGTELRRTLVWVDAGGATRPLPFQERAYLFPVLLPGAKEAIVETAEAPHTLWRGDLGSGALTQLTREGANHRPVVSPDGKLMAFSSDRVVPRSLFLQATDGSGKAEQLTHGPAPHDVTSWSADGRYLAFTERSPETGLDIWVLPLQGERRPRPFIKTSAGEDSAVFSPDGRWIAYVSNESGRFEVLVTAFPGPGPRKQISTSGGEMPVFARDGGLLYRHGDQVLRVTIGGEPSLHASAPSVAFTMPRSLTSLPLPNFALSPDGRGLLTVRYPDAVPQQMTVVVNWFDELRRLTAAPR